METKLAARERPKDDPTPLEKEPPVVHQDVKGVEGGHVTVGTVKTAGVMKQKTTYISQVQDTRASLQEKVRILGNKTKVRQKEWEDTNLQIQKLEDLLQQQQDYAKMENRAEAEDQKQIRRLTTELEMQKSNLAELENDILPTLEAKREQVQEQLAEYEKTAPEKMKALKEQMQTLSEDLKTYGANLADGRKKVEDLFKQIQQLEKDILDKRKHQKAKMQHDADALRDVQAEQARQKKQLENGNRAIEELQRATIKQDDEMKKMKSDNIKLKDEKEAAERKTKKQDDEMKKTKSDNIKLKDEKEAAERKIKELRQREATLVKTIQNLTEQKQKASTEPSKIPSQSESVSHFQLTTQESDQHASNDQSQSEIVRRHPAKNQAASNALSQTVRTPVTTTKKPATQATPSPADCKDLIDASRRGNLEKVKRILSQGVDVNCRRGGQTPVMWAAWYGHRDVVELLVSRGANVSLVDGGGDNTLHFACMDGDVETVEFVLSLNVVDINARNKRGQTAADVARSRGHTRVADLLVSRGAQ